MLIEEAIKILNQHNHNGESTYELIGDIVMDIYSEYPFTIFEAIAIAEKYKRDNQ
jgi:hypothetical protein